MTPGDPDSIGGETPGSAGSGRRGSPFREQALRHKIAAHDEGSVLRLTPMWTRWAFWLVASLAVFVVLFLVFGTVTEYAEGSAFVRADDAVVLTSAVDGVVAEVLVEPGSAVAAGDLLVRLHDETERAELARLTREFEGHLIERLRDPADESTAAALPGLRAAMEEAERRAEQRLFRAPRHGIVSDVRAHPGLAVAPGSAVAALSPEETTFTLIALLPGHHRPLLNDGGALRVEMRGFRYAHHWLEIASVSDRVIGPSEARRLAGPDLGDALSIDGPIVLVRAPLPSDGFKARGRRVAYFDGMQARAEAPVRRERLLFSVAPWLRGLFGGESDA